MPLAYLVVLSLQDPVARRVHDLWGTPPATGEQVDGTPVRRLANGAWVLSRSPLHILDDRVEDRLPASIRAAEPTLVFPSIHRSDSGTRCFTVHPLGNFGGSAEVGGAPRALNPAAPQLMTDALRRLDEAGRSTGLRATFEATHHGPQSSLPSFFAEIGFGDDPEPPPDAVRQLGSTLVELDPDPTDRVVVGVGGGHYAPHFTDLALKRHWAFGHVISRHALLTVDVETARLAMTATPGVEGALYARAADFGLPAGAALVPRLSENLAPRRGAGGS
ncbi:MAG TPA: D-aminoacyl-tRNA deacylase [Thermoplasmata archaeon]|nr:D-aminoacyl-tRNA deacylase [Thermoplasmata archaeon]